MITIATWLWKSTGWRQGYTHKHVNALQRMVSANLAMPHRFLCITDMPEEAKKMNCESFPLWHTKKSNGQIDDMPNCWRRLKLFSEDARGLVGDRFVSMDLDCVVVGDLTPLFTKPDDFVIMKGEACFYNGSMWMMDTGCRKQVWDDFDPMISPLLARQGLNRRGERNFGSDQAWISVKLGDKEQTWSSNDGVYQFNNMDPCLLPKNARVVFFAGGQKPWSPSSFNDLQNIYRQYE